MSFKTYNDANFSAFFPTDSPPLIGWRGVGCGRITDSCVSSLPLAIDLLDVYGACLGINIDIHVPTHERRLRRPEDLLSLLIDETGFQILLVPHSDQGPDP